MNKIMNKIICADVLDGIKKIEDNSVHLVVTSPPYNTLTRNNKKYDKCEDNLPYKNYLNWLKEVFSDIYRVMVPGGRCAINIDAVTNRQEDADEEYLRAIYPHLYNLMKEIGWTFGTEICWYKQNASGKQTAWGSWDSASSPKIRRTHEYILVFCKEKWQLDGNSELSDMTTEEFCKYTLSTWFIQPETRRLCGHPAPFPTELAKRLIKLFSYRENIVLDPFSGTGTTCYMAKLLGRNYIGIDNSKKYCDFAEERMGSIDALFQEEYIPRSERLKKIDNIEQKETNIFDG